MNDIFYEVLKVHKGFTICERKGRRIFARMIRVHEARGKARLGLLKLSAILRTAATADILFHVQLATAFIIPPVVAY